MTMIITQHSQSQGMGIRPAAAGLLRCGCLLLLLMGMRAHAAEKSGSITKPETWSGDITITGNVDILRTEVVVLPGTRITFAGKFTISPKTGSFFRCEGTAESPIHISAEGPRASIGINGGRGSVAFCRLSRVNLGSWYPQGQPPILKVEDCVMIHSQLACYAQEVVVRRNYIHAGTGKYAVVEIPPGSEVTDNIFDGGSWVTKSLGGKVSGNVFISLTIPKGGSINDHTHEHVVGIHPKSTIERNIFIGQSYAALMSIGPHNGDGALIRNNTIDQRRGNGCGFMFHLTKPKPHGITLRNNLFMRCRGIIDEEKTPDAIASTDYNCFAAVPERHLGVVMTGKEVGDEGFGRHSITLGSIDGVCQDPDFGHPFPFAGEHLLSGEITVADALKRYRDAYTPKAGSPLIDAGSPEDAEEVADGKCDIGAVEFVK